MSLKVAVAGVTSGLGHAIVSALLDSGDLDVVLLTRSSSSATDLTHFTSRGALLKSVDYFSIPDLISALAGVDTVISTIFSYHDPSSTLNLMKASRTAGVRRFAPSDFAFSSAAAERLGLYKPKLEILAALKESGLEYTSFQNGIFMDYLASGAPKAHEGPLRMHPFIVNVVGQKAAIPGTGNEKMTFTTVADVGRLVTAAVKLKERWPRELGMEGETTTYNRVVRDVEAVTGKKIDVEYLDRERMANALEETKDDEMSFFHNQLLDVVAVGLGAVTPTLNGLVPHVSVTSIKDFLEEYWRT
jgi:nucleoside-diphosphate-sugar epimerase